MTVSPWWAPHLYADRRPFLIGRAESADLRVESVEISREHAEITERNGMWLVRSTCRSSKDDAQIGLPRG